MCSKRAQLHSWPRLPFHASCWSAFCHRSKLCLCRSVPGLHTDPIAQCLGNHGSLSRYHGHGKGRGPPCSPRSSRRILATLHHFFFLFWHIEGQVKQMYNIKKNYKANTVYHHSLEGHCQPLPGACLLSEASFISSKVITILAFHVDNFLAFLLVLILYVFLSNICDSLITLYWGIIMYSKLHFNVELAVLAHTQVHIISYQEGSRETPASACHPGPSVAFTLSGFAFCCSVEMEPYSMHSEYGLLP